MEATNTYHIALEVKTRQDAGDYNSNEFKEFIRTYNPYIMVTNEGDTYGKNYINNTHHYTTKFHRESFLPYLSNILHFDINWDDYKVVERYDYIEEQKFDISFLKPKQDGKWYIGCYSKNIGYQTTFGGLMFNDLCEHYLSAGSWMATSHTHMPITGFHKLYAFPHECSKIINLNTNHNNRRLLISGDSQMIPDIPFLATIYKEVWYLDNRIPNAFSMKKYIENESFDDLLIVIGHYPTFSIKKYLNENFL